jgi:hypothetical protein
LVTFLIPAQYQQALTDLVQQNSLAKKAFKTFQWESEAAFQYLVASFLMLLCFMGFGHYVVKLTERVCNMPENGINRLLLVTGALVGLPPFFRYVSYPYDPAQLFLFTLALYFLAVHRTKPFFFAFVACCINKETAVLLIPIYCLTFRKQYSSHRQYWGTILGLIFIYVCIKATLTWYFNGNPGSFVEFHLLNHNIPLLTDGWTFTGLISSLGLAILIIYPWREKPTFLRFSFLCVLPPLVSFALIFGFVDEWRGYYEAYPIAFGLLVHTLLRLNDVFRQDRDPANQTLPVDVPALHRSGKDSQ